MLTNLGQSTSNGFRFDRRKVKSLAPRQNRDWDFFRIGRAEYEFDIEDKFGCGGDIRFHYKWTGDNSLDRASNRQIEK